MKPREQKYEKSPRKEKIKNSSYESGRKCVKMHDHRNVRKDGGRERIKRPDERENVSAVKRKVNT